MASVKKTFAASTFAAFTFGAGTWRGTGVQPPEPPPPDDVQELPRPGTYHTPEAIGGGGRRVKVWREEDYKDSRTSQGTVLVGGRAKVSCALSMPAWGGVLSGGSAVLSCAWKFSGAGGAGPSGHAEYRGLDWIRIQMEDYVLLGITK